jgi:D-alanyl-D-alanine carboxypeptidase/D-alanyl-D-alanine-endopeptidase (penicillin-binding protein 4)
VFRLTRPFGLVSWFVAIALSAGVARADDDLAKTIEAITDGPDFAQASWGILVVDAKSGEPIYSRNPEKLIAPASVTKLFTCATALIVLGPDSTTETPIYRRGKLSDEGTLTGDLILVATGDLTFGGRTTKDGTVAFADNDHTYANSGLSEAVLTDTNPLAGLEALARQVKAAGVREVRGEVLVDDRLFDHTRGSGSGPDTVSPILVNDNVIDLTVTPGSKAGEPATVKLRPETAFLQADVDVTTGGKGSGVRITLNSVGPHQFTVRGSVPEGGKPHVRVYAVDDPTAFARGLFIEALRREGVRVLAAVARPGRVDLPEKDGYGKMTKVGSFTSPPFREAVKVTLKVSHNLYASTLPCLVAAKKGGRAAEYGLKEQRKVLADLGVPVSTISFGGGAGGAPSDFVTPRAAVKLLQAMAKRPEWDAYKAGFPTLGVDGTLATVVPADSPARAKAFGKTGTLIWGDAMNGRSLLRSKALAGVMTTAKGTDLVYAMFVNDVPLPPGVGASREGKVLGKLCEVLYTHGP